MDELTLIRDLADDHPLPQRERLAEVRAKLLAEIAPPRKRRFRLVGVSSIGIAAAAAIAVVVTSLPGTPRGPDQSAAPSVESPKVLTAAAVLDYAAEATLREPTVAPRPDQYVYMKTVEKDGAVERWAAADGKRPGYVISSLPSWTVNGPSIACYPYELSVPTKQGSQDHQGCQTDGGYLAANPKTTDETMRFVSDEIMPGQPVDPGDFIKSSFELASDYMLSPQLQAALFKAMKEAHVPDQTITVREHEHDGAGREGIGLVWQANGTDVGEFIFDSKTYQFLGTPQSAITALKVVDHLKQR